jgi:protein required for attachment to host cells
MTTWVLVADSSRARLFCADKALGALEERESFAHPEGRSKTQDLTTDRPGRSSGNGPNMDYDVEPKRQEAMAFAKALSERLRSGRNDGEFDKLYIVAAPTFLGLLRNKLDIHTAQMLVGEVNKDLTRLDPAKIRSHLPERL